MGEQREQRSGWIAVLLPAMFGPVTSAKLGSLPPSLTSTGTNSAPSSRSNTGWRAPARSHSGDSIMFGRMDPSRRAVAANVASTSISAINAAAAFKWLPTALTCRMHRSNSSVPLDGLFTGGELFPKLEFFGDVAFAVPQCLLAQCEGTLSRWGLVTSMPYPNTRLNMPAGKDVVLLWSSCWYWVSQRRHRAQGCVLHPVLRRRHHETVRLL